VKAVISKSLTRRLTVQDDERLDFPTLHDAKCAAVTYAGQLLADVAEHFWDEADFDLTVTDENGLILFSMRVVGIEAPAIRSADRSTQRLLHHQFCWLPCRGRWRAHELPLGF
jgi:hypothetical protein